MAPGHSRAWHGPAGDGESQICRMRGPQNPRSGGEGAQCEQWHPLAQRRDSPACCWASSLHQLPLQLPSSSERLEGSPCNLPKEPKPLRFGCLAGHSAVASWGVHPGTLPNPACPRLPTTGMGLCCPGSVICSSWDAWHRGKPSVGGLEEGGVSFRLSCYLSDTYQAARSRRPNFSTTAC